jgi:hypothetical protein
VKVTVYLTTTASMTVEVEVPDDTDPTEVEEKAVELAWEIAPTDVCAQCGGWREKWSLELGEWEPNDGEDGGIHIHES